MLADARQQYDHEYYEANKDTIKARKSAKYALITDEQREAKNAAWRAWYEKRRQWYLDILSACVCVDCGNTDVRVMCWHHRDPADKSFTVSENLKRKLADILHEMSKCDVLCRNCHAIRHWQ